MKRSKSSRHKHNHRNPLQRLFGKIKRTLRGIFTRDSAPKEYRPYLGPDASPEEIEEKKYENTRASLKSPSHIRQEKRERRSLSERWEIYKRDRQKKRFKSKIKKKQLKKEKKRKRVEFIRRFIPEYKKESNVIIEFSQDDSQAEKEKIKHKGNFIYTLNSTVIFMMAYIIVYLLYQITVLVVASNWKLDSVLYYFDLAFNDFSPLWNRLNIIITTLSGPLFCLLLGMLFFRVLARKVHDNKLLKLLILWIGIHGFNLFFGAFASGVSFDEGLGYVAAWLYFSVFFKILFAMLFLFILGIIGYYSASAFLDTSYSLSRIRQENRIRFLFFQVVLPWVIGASLIFLIKLPNNLNYDTGNLVTLAFVIIPVVFNRHAKPSKEFRSLKKPNKIQWLYVIILLLMLIGFRIGLDNGLHFELYYKFIFDLNISPI